MKEGECWYLRLSDPHRVLNEGETDRIHLVMDLKVNDWLRGIMGQPISKYQ
ncbi:aspartyl/asparaginyl beta-hydroxylase domain-containing protein [Algoriphagus aquimarinus]|uniref:aspartyl/asparaginyl beta-hydroxylase domain-containing protein n=1 Tax=Algoriphagus aquimarinus TaxID=237018 RepID=UPI0030DBCA60